MIRHRADHIRHLRDGQARRPRVSRTSGLVLGPLLRYAGETDATVWVETDAACEVEVLGHSARTFEIESHHYALVQITDLEPGNTYEYEVSLDGAKVWPDGEHDFPPCVIRTIA